jgi:predicted dehydrogenase
MNRPNISTKKYRVAIVGAAGTWGRFYTRTYANNPHCEIIGLVDHAQDRRDQIAQHYGVEKVYDELQDLLATEVPDMVSVIVPVSQNYPCVTACAKAGVRVVSCEKPISHELHEADEIIRICREHGTLLGCSQAGWATPLMPKTIEWVQQGHIGRLTAAAIPGGLPTEASGGGCVQLAALRILTGMDVEWVEGYTLPAAPGFVAEGTPPKESDLPAYGRLGLTGGIVCEIIEPKPNKRVSTFVSAEGENGQAFLASPRPVLIQGKGAAATPVYPDFLDEPNPNAFDYMIEGLIRAHETGAEPLSSGDDFRHSLEVAMALVRSACNGHQRIALPFTDRSLKLYPHPYRFKGGDVAGWQSIGYDGPPSMDL